MSIRRFVNKVIDTSLAVDTNWFGADVGKTLGPHLGNFGTTDPEKHTLMMVLDSPAVVVVKYKMDGQTVEMSLNAGQTLTAGAVYMFDLLVPEGASYNIQYTGIAGPQNLTAIISASDSINV